MRRMFTAGSVALATLVAVLAAETAQAHHPITIYDTDSEVTLRGRVIELRYTNPHSWLIVEAEDGADGRLARWAFEAEGASNLQRRGFMRDTVTPGMIVTVRGHPLKDGRPAALLASIVLPDGTTLDL